MKIELVNPYGYCQGVAIAIALSKIARNENPSASIYTLGPLVHNKQTIDDLKEQGINTLSNPKYDLLTLLKHLHKDNVVIFAAHGHEKKLEEYANKHKMITYDAICPIVKRNFKQIEDEVKNKHEVIWIGNPRHTETKAALSISKHVHCYDEKLLENDYKLLDTSPFVLNQSTLNYDELEDTYAQILAVYPDARINKSVCDVARTRQEAVKNLPNDVDAIIIVGDKTSANTNQLTAVAHSSHEEATIMQVSSLEEIDLSKLENKNYIAIASGAATPTKLVGEMKEYLERKLN